MPKFYGQNRKSIDPRYFADEMLEEAVVTPPRDTFPGVDPMDKAKALASKAMQQQMSGEIPPWETGNEETAEDLSRLTKREILTKIEALKAELSNRNEQEMAYPAVGE